MEMRFECTLTWDDLNGEDTVRRHCGTCDKPVYNLSGMTRVDAKRFLDHHGEAPPCVRFLSRDGKIVHNGDPFEQLRAQRYGARKLVAGALVAQAAFLTLSDDPARHFFDPFVAVGSFFLPRHHPTTEVMGAMVPRDHYGETEFINWREDDVDCIGRANCRAEAINAFKVGRTLAEHADADITNPYESYKQFDRALRLLKKGGIDETPNEMDEILTLQAAVKAGIDAKFKQSRLNYRNFETRKMYDEMASELKQLQAHFADKRCLYNQWAVQKERDMKDNNIYPHRPLDSREP